MKPETPPHWSEALPLAVIAADSSGIIAHANTEAGRLWPQVRLIGAALSSLFATGDPLLALLEDALGNGSATKAYDHTALTADGRELSGHMHMMPLWPEGLDAVRPAGVLLTLDIPQQPHHAERRQLQRHSTRWAGLAAAMLAHEIKNPLSSIKSAAQLMERDAENTAMSGLIVQEVDRIAAMLTRMEYLSSALPIEPTPLNIHEVLHYVRGVLDPSLTQAVRFAEQFDPSLPEIAGERGLLVQLFLNLLKNAAEALQGRADARITLRTACLVGTRLGTARGRAVPVAIEIEDNGPGIPEALQAELFTPFVSRKKGGHGLGLVIASKIAADHHGQVELIESRPGRTVFRVVLPSGVH